MMNKLLEVVDQLVEEGVQRKIAVDAVESVCSSDMPYASAYRCARAVIDKDWGVLSPLYTAVCTQYLLSAGYVIEGMYFTEDDRYCAYYVVVFKDDMASGSRVFGVKRVLGIQSEGFGLYGYNLLQQL